MAHGGRGPNKLANRHPKRGVSGGGGKSSTATPHATVTCFTGALTKWSRFSSCTSVGRREAVQGPGGGAYHPTCPDKILGFLPGSTENGTRRAFDACDFFFHWGKWGAVTDGAEPPVCSRLQVVLPFHDDRRYAVRWLELAIAHLGCLRGLRTLHRATWRKVKFASTAHVVRKILFARPLRWWPYLLVHNWLEFNVRLLCSASTH
ncbi:hypothetical protein HD554DRAFT_2132209 [Boletus coccyginus]|nr:hypothetical protein HD554DRAFT_2132209 [Boletus coccyginus]